jgi:phage-related protein
MWTVEFLDDNALSEYLALPEDMQAKFARIATMIESLGLSKVHEPYVKHITGKLWEMRLIGKDGIARSLYVTASGRRVVVLRTFIKKTQKTPTREIEYALKRVKELKE